MLQRVRDGVGGVGPDAHVRVGRGGEAGAAAAGAQAGGEGQRRAVVQRHRQRRARRRETTQSHFLSYLLKHKQLRHVITK